MWVFQWELISGFMLGLEFVPPEGEYGTTAVFDLGIIRLFVYHVDA